MKRFVLLLIVLLKTRGFISKPVNGSTLVGMSDQKLNDLIWKALEGFREVIREGDNNLSVDSLEPYVIDENLLWYYDDGIGKYRIYVDSVGPSFLHGLSTYTIENVSANMSNLDVEIKLNFNRVQAKGKYKAGGYLFQKMMPLYGQGPIDAKAESFDAKICLNMSLVDDSYLSVDGTSVSLEMDNFVVKASNIFKIPGAYTNSLVNDVLKRMYKKYKTSMEEEVNEVLLELADDTFYGMTLDELFDLLEYLGDRKTEFKMQLRKKKTVRKLLGVH